MNVFLRIVLLHVSFVSMALVCIATAGCYRREELRHSLWTAGSVSNKSGNDIWMEYGAVSGNIVGIYRDYDGDGLVDECLLFSGPSITVFRSSGHDGLLDTMRDIREPLEVATRLAKGAPEAGPFTRVSLDELARVNPMHRPVEDQKTPK